MKEEVLELSELLSQLHAAVDREFPDSVWVKCEISSIQTRTNGHCYMELSQSGPEGVVAKARAVIWRNRFAPLQACFREATGENLQAGISVLLMVQVSFSELYGLTLTVDGIEPSFTLGEAELRRRQTIAALESEGLLDRQQALVLPVLPRTLAVISAPDAAGYGDFCRHLEENEYGFAFSVTLFPAVMQGQEAPASITDAIQTVEALGDGYDAVLILRGGGSVLDLSCFDDYALCFAIANCTVPVFTAVGHERDRHVADMVAFRSVKTPTALADGFISAIAAEDERLVSFRNRLVLAFNARIAAMSSRIDVLYERIHGADPRNVLSRGYSLVVAADGKIVKKPSDLHRGDRFRIIFSEGEINAEVIE